MTVVEEEEAAYILAPYTQARAVPCLSLAARAVGLIPACQDTPCFLLSYPRI